MTTKFVLLVFRNLLIFSTSLLLFLPLLTEEAEVSLQETCAVLGSIIFLEGLRNTGKFFTHFSSPGAGTR